MLDRFIFTFDGRSVKLIYTQKMMKGTNCMSLIPHFKNKYNLSLLLHILNSWWFAGEEILATCSFRHQFRHQNQTPSATHEVLCRVSERRMGPPENSSEQTTDCGAHLPSGRKSLSFPFYHNSSMAYWQKYIKPGNMNLSRNIFCEDFFPIILCFRSPLFWITPLLTLLWKKKLSTAVCRY